jgi:hypothetical protein
MERVTDHESGAQRSATQALIAAGAIATPVAIVAQPIVGAWANEKFGQDASPEPKQQPPAKTD